MDSNSSFRIHRTSFQSFKIHEFRDKRKLIPSNFSEFNNKLVAAFTTNGVENSVSFQCLTFFFLFLMLKNTFTTFPVSFQVFWCLEHTTNCFFFFQIRAEIPKATPILAFRESSKHLNDKILTKMKNSSVHLNNFRF